jgi:hypothetical protein
LRRVEREECKLESKCEKEEQVGRGTESAKKEGNRDMAKRVGKERENAK